MTTNFRAWRVPFGDFFGVGHGKIRDYSSAMFEMSLNPGASTASFNCWVKMPFRERAKVVVNNESEAEIRLFHYFDYREMESLPEKLYYFHSNWRAEMPRRATPLIDGKEGANLTGDYNYCILDTRGEGNFLGCSLSVDNFTGGWWGEGDDMIFHPRRTVSAVVPRHRQRRLFQSSVGDAEYLLSLCRHAFIQH